jgi:hypothetical protein
VAVQDKFHSTGFTYPLPVYAIHQYFLKDDTLNLLCRTTPMNAGSGPRYSFFQLNLSNAPDSRQFQPLKRYSFSPDNQSLLAVFDGAGQPDPVALIQLGQPPAKLGWIYKGSLNLFQRFLPAMGKDVVLNDPIGWSADAFTIAFVVSAPDGIQDAQGQPVLRDYLACARLDGESFRVLAAPVDLSPYKFRKGSVITDLKCEGDKAVLFFSQSDSSDILKAEIPLPKLPETKSQ